MRGRLKKIWKGRISEVSWGGIGETPVSFTVSSFFITVAFIGWVEMISDEKSQRVPILNLVLALSLASSIDLYSCRSLT